MIEEGRHLECEECHICTHCFTKEITELKSIIVKNEVDVNEFKRQLRVYRGESELEKMYVLEDSLIAYYVSVNAKIASLKSIIESQRVRIEELEFENKELRQWAPKKVVKALQAMREGK